LADLQVLPTLQPDLFGQLLLVGKLYLLYNVTPIFRYDLGVHFQCPRCRNLFLDLACLRHFSSTFGLTLCLEIFDVPEIGFWFFLLEFGKGVIGVVCFGVDVFSVGADVVAFFVEVVGSHEAFILIFVGLCLAYIEVLAQSARQLLLEKFMLRN
jgi:hypothetical protein